MTKLSCRTRRLAIRGGLPGCARLLFQPCRPAGDGHIDFDASRYGWPPVNPDDAGAPCGAPVAALPPPLPDRLLAMSNKSLGIRFSQGTICNRNYDDHLLAGSRPPHPSTPPIATFDSGLAGCPPPLGRSQTLGYNAAAIHRDPVPHPAPYQYIPGHACVHHEPIACFAASREEGRFRSRTTTFDAPPQLTTIVPIVNEGAKSHAASAHTSATISRPSPSHTRQPTSRHRRGETRPPPAPDPDPGAVTPRRPILAMLVEPTETFKVASRRRHRRARRPSAPSGRRPFPAWCLARLQNSGPTN
jgi:hypothetical protein